MKLAYSVLYTRRNFTHQFLGVGHGDIERAITESGAGRFYQTRGPTRQLAQSQNTLYRIEAMVRRKGSSHDIG